MVSKPSIPITIMGDTWWVIIICPCVNVFSLMGGVTEADVGFPTEYVFSVSTVFRLIQYKRASLYCISRKTVDTEYTYYS